MKAVERKDALALKKARDRFRRWHEVAGRVTERPGGHSHDERMGQVLAQVFGVKAKQALAWWYGSGLSPMARKNPRWLLSSEISAALRDVRFVLWWNDDERFLPGLYCRDLTNA